MLEIVQLSSDDIATMRALNTLFGEAFEDPDAFARNPPDDAYLKRLLAMSHVIVLVAVEEGEILGGLVAYELTKYDQARSEIYIYDLAVAEAHRQRGIATALIERLQHIAKDRGTWVIFVQADYGDEPAIALYTKLGTREDVMHFDIPVAGEEKP